MSFLKPDLTGSCFCKALPRRTEGTLAGPRAASVHRYFCLTLTGCYVKILLCFPHSKICRFQSNPDLQLLFIKVHRSGYSGPIVPHGRQLLTEGVPSGQSMFSPLSHGPYHSQMLQRAHQLPVTSAVKAVLSLRPAGFIHFHFPSAPAGVWVGDPHQPLDLSGMSCSPGIPSPSHKLPSSI